jgi:hypothetical protein
VSITTPSDAFSSQTPCICASGTASADAAAVYVNGITATGTTAWTACPDNAGVPLAMQSDPRISGGVRVTAAAVDADGNWGYAIAAGSYTGTATAWTHCKSRKFGW